jgi:hypothetical protein
MELLLILVTTLLTEGYKKMVSKVGEKTAKLTIYAGVFVASSIFTGLTTTNLVSYETLQKLTTFFLASVGTFEVVIKWLFKENIIDKIK